MLRHQVNASRLASSDSLIALCGSLVLLAVIGLTSGLAAASGEMLTRNTIRLALAWYTLALCLMMRLAPGDWYATTPIGWLARWCWTWALLCFLVHLAMAFHFYDHWSHAAAYERTRQVSGVGEGLYISYGFTALWVCDVAYWWARPHRYAARPGVVGWLLHGFMLFIIFNATIVYEAGAIRWAGVAMFALLAGAWVISRRGRRERQPSVLTDG